MTLCQPFFFLNILLFNPQFVLLVFVLTLEGLSKALDIGNTSVILIHAEVNVIEVSEDAEAVLFVVDHIGFGVYFLDTFDKLIEVGDNTAGGYFIGLASGVVGFVCFGFVGLHESFLICGESLDIISEVVVSEIIDLFGANKGLRGEDVLEAICGNVKVVADNTAVFTHMLFFGDSVGI